MTKFPVMSMLITAQGHDRQFENALCCSPKPELVSYLQSLQQCMLGALLFCQQRKLEEHWHCFPFVALKVDIITLTCMQESQAKLQYTSCHISCAIRTTAKPIPSRWAGEKWNAASIIESFVSLQSSWFFTSLASNWKGMLNKWSLFSSLITEIGD